MERISADAMIIANAIKEGAKEIADAIRESKQQITEMNTIPMTRFICKKKK